MLATAFRTPLPPYRALSPSLSSSASRSPVDAPEGTAARPNAAPSNATSTSTVGLPRESRISRPWTRVIFIGFRLRALGFWHNDLCELCDLCGQLPAAVRIGLEPKR